MLIIVITQMFIFSATENNQICSSYVLSVLSNIIGDTGEKNLRNLHLLFHDHLFWRLIKELMHILMKLTYIVEFRIWENVDEE